MSNRPNLPSRPRLVSRHNRYWLPLVLCGLVFFTFMLMNLKNPGVGIVLLVLAVGSIATGLIMAHEWHFAQRPISGRVVYRYVEGSGFASDNFNGDTTLNKLSGYNVTGMSHTEIRYWLYVANAHSGNRWFPVPKNVFDAHTIGTDYDARVMRTATIQADPDL